MRKILVILGLTAMMIFLGLEADAQCAMCKAAAEQSEEKGLNMGILYLFITPYIIIGTIAFLWWRNRKSVDENEEEFRSALSEVDAVKLN